MSLISVHAPVSMPLRRRAKWEWFHLSRRVKLIAAAAMLLFASAQIWQTLQPPAQTIKGQLSAAAAETAALPWSMPRDQVERAVARDFPGQAVRIDAARFPVEIAVSISGLDRDTCLAARQLASRLEGSVVVALDGYMQAGECRAANAMTWHIMP
ncbi:MAG TPA: hypothetical protein VN668_20050 [Stellaceae bacterium]|nr:hypothetical protein [Stellaceae bacterium]